MPNFSGDLSKFVIYTDAKVVLKKTVNRLFITMYNANHAISSTVECKKEKN